MNTWLYSLFTEHITSDLPFYVSDVQTVLELGCGTGRVLLPCAQNGAQCVGIDHSTEALDSCRKTFERSDLSVTLHHMDMTEFELNQSFEQIQLPLRTFQLLPPSLWSLCLKKCHQHLVPNGTLKMHLSPHIQESPTRAWTPIGTRQSTDGGWFLLEEAVHHESHCTNLYHKASHISPQASNLQSWLMHHKLHHISEKEIRNLLEETGFQIPQLQPFGQDIILSTTSR